MSENPAVRGTNVSLTQVSPGGIAVPAGLALVALFFVYQGAVSVGRGDLTGVVLGGVIGVACAASAVTRVRAARASGVFFDGRTFEHRLLGRVTETWPREHVAAVQQWRPGLRLLDRDGHPLVTCDYRHWKEAQVAAFAAAVDLPLVPAPNPIAGPARPPGQ